jgi:hypothetical protein
VLPKLLGQKTGHWTGVTVGNGSERRPTVTVLQWDTHVTVLKAERLGPLQSPLHTAPRYASRYLPPKYYPEFAILHKRPLWFVPLTYKTLSKEQLTRGS